MKTGAFAASLPGLLVLFLLTFSAISPVSAQFSLSGEIRPKAEFRDGYRMMPQPGSKPAGLVNQRTRLSLLFEPESNVSLGVAVQDLRIWGQDNTMGTDPSFGIYEAWVELAVRENLSIRAGRQELRYDNQRLMAINDWALTGRTHDALVMKYRQDNGSELHIGAGFNQREDRLFETHYRLDNYKTLNYIWYNTDLGSATNASFLFLADGYEHPDNPETLYVRATWSSFLVISPGSVTLRLQPAYQHGNTSRGQDIGAYFLLGELSGDLTANMSSTLGFELFSGQDHLDPGDKFTAFDKLFGAGHGKNGFMDYFTAFPAHPQNAGLFNPYLKNNFRLSDQTSLNADLHLFFLENNYPDPADPTRAIDKYLGTELDLVLNHRFNEFTEVLLGYSVMFGSESMEVIRGGSKDEFAHWGFLMIRMSPVFF